MFLVNFMGGYAATPALLRHHNTWCSFADTVMPQFFFAAGMALRLVALREGGSQGRAAALRHGLRRGFALLIMGLLWHGPHGFSNWKQIVSAPWTELTKNVFLTSAFQTLTHIGLTSLWVLPVILGSARSRILWAAGSGVLHAVLSHWFWYETLHRWGVVDGGPLGFLTWSLPFVAGSLALDAVWNQPSAAAEEPSPSGRAAPVVGRRMPYGVRCLIAGAVICISAGYALSCLTAGGVIAALPFSPPRHPVDMWTMSQRAGSLSYLTFSAGLSLAVFVCFHWWSDRLGKSLTLFSDLGKNALGAYLIHSVVMDVTEGIGPKDSPLAWAVTVSTAGFLISWGITRWMNRRNLFLRL